MRPLPSPSTIRPVDRAALGALLGGCLLMGVTGCGRTPEGEFHAYPNDPAAKAPEGAQADIPPSGRDAAVTTVDPSKSGSTPAALSDSASSDGSSRSNVDPTRTAAADDAALAESPSRDVAPPGDAPSVAVAANASPVTTTQKPQRVAPGDAMLRRVPEPNDDAAVAELPPRPIQLLIAEKEFRKEKGILRVSYDDIDLLKVLNMEPVPFDAASHFPPWLKSLDGQRVRLRGFMYPPYEETGLTHFVLARDNQICCFGRNPKVYDLVDIRMKPGVTTDYIQNRPFDVIGTFHIQPDGDGTRLFELYRIDDATVFER